MFGWLTRIFSGRSAAVDGLEKLSLPAPTPRTTRQHSRCAATDPRHPLGVALVEYLRGRNAKVFDYRSRAMQRIAVECGYKPSSWSPFLCLCAKKGIVRHRRRGVYEWIGYPKQELQAPAPVVPHAVTADHVHTWIATSPDGLSMGQLTNRASRERVSYGQLTALIAMLVEGGRVTDVSGRYYSSAVLEAATKPKPPQPPHH